jgi:hypothetical protein
MGGPQNWLTEPTQAFPGRSLQLIDPTPPSFDAELGRLQIKLDKPDCYWGRQDPCMRVNVHIEAPLACCINSRGNGPQTIRECT